MFISIDFPDFYNISEVFQCIEKMNEDDEYKDLLSKLKNNANFEISDEEVIKLCHIKNHMMPSWTCQCGSFSSTRIRCDKEKLKKIIQDFDCDGIKNNEDKNMFLSFDNKQECESCFRGKKIIKRDKNGNFIIDMNIQVKWIPENCKDKYSDSLLSEYSKATSDFWSQRRSDYSIISKINYSDTNISNSGFKVNMFCKDKKGKYKKNSDCNISEGRSNSKNFCLDEGDDFKLSNGAQVLLHETGHILGLADDYIEKDYSIFQLTNKCVWPDPISISDYGEMLLANDSSIYDGSISGLGIMGGEFVKPFDRNFHKILSL